MMTRTCVIRNRLGLHARAAAKFVHTATLFASQIRVSRDGRTMDGKSIMGILLLAAAAGSSVIITADGRTHDLLDPSIESFVEISIPSSWINSEIHRVVDSDPKFIHQRPLAATESGVPAGAATADHEELS